MQTVILDEYGSLEDLLEKGKIVYFSDVNKFSGFTLGSYIQGVFEEDGIALVLCVRYFTSMPLGHFTSEQLKSTIYINRDGVLEFFSSSNEGSQARSKSIDDIFIMAEIVIPRIDNVPIIDFAENVTN